MSFHTTNGAAAVRPFAFLRTGGAPRAAKNVSEIPLPTWFILVCRRSRYSCSPAAMMVSMRAYASSEQSSPSRRSTGCRNIPTGVPEMACTDSRARTRQYWMARGNSFSKQQELDDAIGRDAPVTLPVHLERAGRAQHGGPLDVVGRRADVGRGGQQEKVLHVEDARGLVGALQHAAEPAEVPALVVGHRGVGHAGEQMAGHPDRREQILRVGPASGVGGAEFTIR